MARNKTLPAAPWEKLRELTWKWTELSPQNKAQPKLKMSRLHWTSWSSCLFWLGVHFWLAKTWDGLSLRSHHVCMQYFVNQNSSKTLQIQLQVIQSDKANVGPALRETEQKVSSLGSTWRLLGYRKGCRPKVVCSKPKENMKGSRNRGNGERKCQPNWCGSLGVYPQFSDTWISEYI